MPQALECLRGTRRAADRAGSARRVARDAANRHDAHWELFCIDSLRAEINKLRSGNVPPQDDERNRYLFGHRIGHAYQCLIQHIGVMAEYRPDVLGQNLHAAEIDDIVGSAAQRDESGRVGRTGVARIEPAVRGNRD